MEHRFTGNQVADPEPQTEAVINTCGFWAAFYSLAITMSVPISSITSEPSWLKTVLNAFQKEYRGGGLTRDTYSHFMNTLPDPVGLLDDSMLTEMEMVRYFLYRWVSCSEWRQWSPYRYGDNGTNAMGLGEHATNVDSPPDTDYERTVSELAVRKTFESDPIPPKLGYWSNQPISERLMTGARAKWEWFYQEPSFENEALVGC